MADERHNAAFMVGVILGALAGAVATLLLTPLSGDQTRAQLNASARRAAAQLPGGAQPTPAVIAPPPLPPASEVVVTTVPAGEAPTVAPASPAAAARGE